MPRPSPQTERVVAIARLLAAHPDEGFTISEIARRLRLGNATVWPMLVALTEAGWLLRDPATKTFHLGPALIELGEASARSFPAVSLARQAMVRLSEELGVSSAAFTPSDGHATVAEQVWDVRSSVPPLRLGQWVPLRVPFGAVFVAWSDDDARKAWLGDLDGEARERVLDALDTIQKRGFVVELHTPTDDRLRGGANIDLLVDELAAEPEFLAGELVERRSYRVSAMSAPVFDGSGRVRLCLALLGFGPSLGGGEVVAIGDRLRRAADEVSRRLAVAPAPPSRRGPAPR